MRTMAAESRILRSANDEEDAMQRTTGSIEDFAGRRENIECGEKRGEVWASGEARSPFPPSVSTKCGCVRAHASRRATSTHRLASSNTCLSEFANEVDVENDNIEQGGGGNDFAFCALPDAIQLNNVRSPSWSDDYYEPRELYLYTLI